MTVRPHLPGYTDSGSTSLGHTKEWPQTSLFFSALTWGGLASTATLHREGMLIPNGKSPFGAAALQVRNIFNQQKKKNAQGKSDPHDDYETKRRKATGW